MNKKTISIGQSNVVTVNAEEMMALLGDSDSKANDVINAFRTFRASNVHLILKSEVAVDTIFFLKNYASPSDLTNFLFNVLSKNERAHSLNNADIQNLISFFNKDLYKTKDLTEEANVELNFLLALLYIESIGRYRDSNRDQIFKSFAMLDLHALVSLEYVQQRPELLSTIKGLLSELINTPLV